MNKKQIKHFIEWHEANITYLRGEIVDSEIVIQESEELIAKFKKVLAKIEGEE